MTTDRWTAGYPTESRHATHRAPAGAPTAQCQRCGATTSRLGLYRVRGKLVCVVDARRTAAKGRAAR